MTKPTIRRTILTLLAFGLAIGAGVAAGESFYKSPALFSTCPDEKASLQSIDRFGPVGIGIELVQPAFVMKIHNVEEGSPAAAAGRLKAGQTIETINGQKLKDIDPRMQLAQILGAAEAGDGVLKFAIKGEAQPVSVKIPVLVTLDLQAVSAVLSVSAVYLSQATGNVGNSAQVDIGRPRRCLTSAASGARFRPCLRGPQGRRTALLQH